MNRPRTLLPSEIECRVGRVWAGGFSILLYKDARCDMAILDETFGPGNWQREHKQIGAAVYCGVGVFNASLEQVKQGLDPWVWKWDVGTESRTEPEKGQASDSFKRACVNWGIGRELYTAPFIGLKAETIPDGRGYKLADQRAAKGLEVLDITYNDDRQIDSLVIGQKGQPIWEWRK